MSRRLIVIGVLIGSVVLISATSGWTVSSTGALANPQESESAALLDDGNVLVFGDAAGAPPELYDATNGSFLPVSSLDVNRARLCPIRRPAAAGIRPSATVGGLSEISQREDTCRSRCRD